MLRIAIELFGNVEKDAPAGEPNPGELLKRKTAGNVVELGSIAAFGFSPLWLLAAASDITHGIAGVPGDARRGAETRGRARRRRDAAGRSTIGRRAAGRVGDDRETRRPATARAGGATCLARRAALEHGASCPRREELAALYAGLSADGRARAAAAARRLDRHGPRASRLRPAGWAASSWSCRTGRTGSRCARRASRPMPAGSRSRTWRRWRGSSTRRTSRGRSGRWADSGGENSHTSLRIYQYRVRGEAPARGSGDDRRAGRGGACSMRRYRCRGAAPTRRASIGCPTRTLGYVVHVMYRASPRRARIASASSAPRDGRRRRRDGGLVALAGTPPARLGSTSTPSPAQRPSACSADITNVQLAGARRGPRRVQRDSAAARVGRLRGAREGLSRLLRRGRPGSPAWNGSRRGAPPGGSGAPGMAIVDPRLLRCDEATPAAGRGVHELVHVFGAVDNAAPHRCRDGHVATSRST